MSRSSHNFSSLTSTLKRNLYHSHHINAYLSYWPHAACPSPQLHLLVFPCSPLYSSALPPVYPFFSDILYCISSSSYYFLILLDRINFLFPVPHSLHFVLTSFPPPSSTLLLLFLHLNWLLILLFLL